MANSYRYDLIWINVPHNLLCRVSLLRWHF